MTTLFAFSRLRRQGRSSLDVVAVERADQIALEEERLAVDNQFAVLADLDLAVHRYGLADLGCGYIASGTGQQEACHCE